MQFTHAFVPLETIHGTYTVPYKGCYALLLVVVYGKSCF